MSDTITVEVDKKYVEFLGDNFTKRYGDYQPPLVGEFMSTIHSSVIDTTVWDEFEAGWRDKLKVDIEEDVCGKFVRTCCEMHNRGDLDLDATRRLIQPVQIPAGIKYSDKHIEALRDAPVVYRKRQAEYLTPMVEAVSGAIEVEDMLELLIEGVFNSMNDRFNHNRAESVVSDLSESLIEKGENDEIDLTDEYFYQGPRHLGILQTGKEKKIASCVCEYQGGYIYPFLLSEEDPVNSEARLLMDNLVESEED